MKGKHATQKGGLNSASQKLETLVEMSISSNNNFVWTNMSWSPKTCSKFFKIQNLEAKVFQILLELWLGTQFIFSWVFTWIIDSTENLMHRIMFLYQIFPLIDIEGKEM